MRFREIIFEDFKTALEKYVNNQVPRNMVLQAFEKYKKLKPRMSPPENNIDWWASNRTFSQFAEYIDNIEGIPTKGQMNKRTGRSHTLVENSEWLIVIPLDKDASCFHGKTTDWCTTKPFQNYYEEYFYKNNITLIYCLHKNTGNKWAIAASSSLRDASEYFDVNDNSISATEFDSQTKLDSDAIINLAFGKNPQGEVKSSRANYVAAIKRINELLPTVKSGEQNPELVNLLFYTKSLSAIESYFDRVGVRSDYDPRLQKLAINLNPNLIQWISNPSESIQMRAVSSEGDNLQYISNPSEAVIMAAIEDSGDSIRFVENQTEKMKIAAVFKGGRALLYVKEPISENVKLTAVTKNGASIRYIDSPSEDVQMAAVTWYPYAIGNIIDKNIIPSKEVILQAVRSSGGSENILDLLITSNVGSSLDEEVYLTAMRSSYDTRSLINTMISNRVPVSKEVQLAAATNDATSIRSILFATNGNIDENIQIAGAKNDGYDFINSYKSYRSASENKVVPQMSAIEEAFKSGRRIDATLKNVMTMGVEPSYTAFANAIDSAEYNTDITTIISYAYQVADNDRTYNKVVEYAKRRAERDDNTMLKQLIDDYVKNSDLDNLDFKPEI